MVTPLGLTMDYILPPGVLQMCLPCWIKLASQQQKLTTTRLIASLCIHIECAMFLVNISYFQIYLILNSCGRSLLENSWPCITTWDGGASGKWGVNCHNALVMSNHFCCTYTQPQLFASFHYFEDSRVKLAAAVD